MKKQKKILFVLGTRPEAIKLAPVILAAQNCPVFKTLVCFTGQHWHMATPILGLFNIQPDYQFKVMKKNQSLTSLTINLAKKLAPVLQSIRPDLVVVQGDTTTAFTTALESFYQKIPVAHIEAGLRTRDYYQPFPEEMNRILISRLASIHLAPTKDAKQNLLQEGISNDQIMVTGNTVVDALLHIHQKVDSASFQKWENILKNKKLILVTAHRRENHGKPLRSICSAIKLITKKFNDVVIICPSHMNPQVQSVLRNELSRTPGVIILDPLPYEKFIYLMSRAYLIVTDSGGIQEEAPSLGIPVLVMREVSERQDGIQIGAVELVGTSANRIFKKVCQLIQNPMCYKKMVPRFNPYGDGNASQRIIQIFSEYCEAL